MARGRRDASGGTGDLGIVLAAFTAPALRGILHYLVDRDRLRQVNALLGVVRNGIKILGPGLLKRSTLPLPHLAHPSGPRPVALPKQPVNEHRLGAAYGFHRVLAGQSSSRAPMTAVWSM